MIFKINNSIALGVSTYKDSERKELRIDILKNGVEVPLVIVENNDVYDGDDAVHVYLYNETDADPAEFMYDTNMDEYLQLAERYL